jgi:hypothetical protein
MGKSISNRQSPSQVFTDIPLPQVAIEQVASLFRSSQYMNSVRNNNDNNHHHNNNNAVA